jgi:hypothetical protein
MGVNWCILQRPSDCRNSKGCQWNRVVRHCSFKFPSNANAVSQVSHSASSTVFANGHSDRFSTIFAKDLCEHEGEQLWGCPTSSPTIPDQRSPRTEQRSNNNNKWRRSNKHQTNIAADGVFARCTLCDLIRWASQHNPCRALCRLSPQRHPEEYRHGYSILQRTEESCQGASARRTHRRGKAGCECDHYAIVPDKLRAAHNSPPVLKVGFAILAKF